MAKRKSKALSAVTARMRVAPKKRSLTTKRVAKGSRPTKKRGKGIDASRFFGAIPDAGKWYVESLEEEARLSAEKAERMAKVFKIPLARGKSRTTRSGKPHKPYDAKISAGILPGLAKRMAKYLKTMRDDR